VVLDGPHAPTSDCDGCRRLFDAELRDWVREIRQTEHSRFGWSAIVPGPVRRWVPAWIRRQERGQAIVETALVLPLLLFVLLATLEAGAMGARWLHYTRLAQELADARGEAPWLDDDAAAVGCVDPQVTVVEGERPRLVLACRYEGVAVAGFSAVLTSTATIP
jgi:hypothetical protein